jgi:sulfide:quinone oxidoreductase
VFAVGDVTSAPVPRAGGIAEGEAATVAEVLIAELTSGTRPTPYDGAGACYVELGDDLVARIDVNSLSYDTPVAKLSGPTAELAEEKRRWGSTRAARWFGEAVSH